MYLDDTGYTKQPIDFIKKMNILCKNLLFIDSFRRGSNNYENVFQKVYREL